MNKTLQNDEDAIYWILKEKEGLDQKESKDLQDWLKITYNKDDLIKKLSQKISFSEKFIILARIREILLNK